MKIPDTPIPPLTDELIARVKNDVIVAKKLVRTGVSADLTTVLHHLEAYRDAVERWENHIPNSLNHREAIHNLSAVHARVKGGKP